MVVRLRMGPDNKWRVESWTPVTPWEICPEEEARDVARWRTIGEVQRIHFEKPVNGTRWKLRLSHWCGCHDDDRTRDDTHRGVSFETFALHSASGEVRTFPDWTSADHDTFKNRIAFTRGQQLWCMDVLRDEFSEPLLLHDLTGKAGWRAVAPY